jgi:zinc finger protein
MTTIEGMLDRIIAGVRSDIEVRKEVDPETTDKMEAFLKRILVLKEFKSGSFEVVLDDPSGDSFLENPYAPSKDPNMTLVHYMRTKEQNELLGLDVTIQ